MHQKANRVYQLTLTLYGGLILSLLAKIWWLNPPPGSMLGISLLQILPLLLPMPGVLKRRLRAASWLCFILCFYFTSGVLELWFRPAQIQGWLISGFTVSLFISSIMLIRWQAAANRLASG